jgi:hypothetical protein
VKSPSLWEEEHSPRRSSYPSKNITRQQPFRVTAVVALVPLPPAPHCQSGLRMETIRCSPGLAVPSPLAEARAAVPPVGSRPRRACAFPSPAARARVPACSPMQAPRSSAVSCLLLQSQRQSSTSAVETALTFRTDSNPALGPSLRAMKHRTGLPLAVPAPFDAAPLDTPPIIGLRLVATASRRSMSSADHPRQAVDGRSVRDVSRCPRGARWGWRPPGGERPGAHRVRCDALVPLGTSTSQVRLPCWER